jgi:hypothetical protein
VGREVSHLIHILACYITTSPIISSGSSKQQRESSGERSIRNRRQEHGRRNHWWQGYGWQLQLWHVNLPIAQNSPNQPKFSQFRIQLPKSNFQSLKNIQPERYLPQDWLKLEHQFDITGFPHPPLPQNFLVKFGELSPTIFVSSDPWCSHSADKILWAFVSVKFTWLHETFNRHRFRLFIPIISLIQDYSFVTTSPITSNEITEETTTTAAQQQSLNLISKLLQRGWISSYATLKPCC